MNNISSVRRCEVCGIVLLNGTKISKYCQTHRIIMKQWNDTLRLIRSLAFKQLPWEYKRRILFIINNPNHKEAMQYEKENGV
jgi:hypothetical protein